ncbi:MAG: OsmC family protein [Bacteroidetes bacterium]|nr:OsmC family protein [Bacteroidota bacterium]
MDKHSYNVSLKWEEGRKGIVSSPELPVKIEVATPPEFDKGVLGIWSPEHLYTAAVLSCFMTTFLAIAEYSKLEYKSFECDAEGVLDKVDGKFLMTEVSLKARLVIDDESKKERAERILEKSEAACLISNSIKTKVNLTTNISF